MKELEMLSLERSCRIRKTEISTPYGIRSKDSRGREFPQEEPDIEPVSNVTGIEFYTPRHSRRWNIRPRSFLTTKAIITAPADPTLEVHQIAAQWRVLWVQMKTWWRRSVLRMILDIHPLRHSGETTLAKLMKDQGGFDHNKHSFRIVTNLKSVISDFDGLNLSWKFWMA
jgi:dGTPase